MKKTSFLQKKLPEILALVWLLALLLSFLVYQLSSNVPPRAFQAVFWLTQNIAATTFTITAAAGLGMWMSKKHLSNPSLRMYCSPLLGFIVLSTCLLLFGLLHLLPPSWLIWLIIIVLNVLFYRPIKNWLTLLKKQVQVLFSRKAPPWLRIMQVGILLLFLMALLIALAPPTQWDSLMYHLSAGKFYIDQGGIVTSFDNYRYSNPSFMIVLFMGLQILAGSEAAALLMWFFGFWLLIGLSVFFVQFNAKPEHSQKQTWIAATLIFSANGIWLSMTRAYSDIALIPYFLGAVLLLLSWLKNPSKQLMVFSGMLCGVLIATKYTAFPFCIGIGLFALFITWKRNKKIKFKPVIILFLSALLVFLPWMAKNWLLDGNPIAPYIWGSPAFDAFDQAGTRPSPSGNSLTNLILLPLQASVFGHEFLDPFQGSVGAFLIGLTPLVLVFWKTMQNKTRGLQIALLTAILPAYLTWTVGAGFSQNLAIVRFYYPMFAILAIMISLVWGDLHDQPKGFPWKKIIIVLAIAALVIGLIQSGFMLAWHNPLPVVLGLESHDSYLRSKLGDFYTINQEIQDLSKKDEKTLVLLLWEPKTFYCQPNCIGDDNLNTWQKAYDQSGSTETILADWRAAGYTHVVNHHQGAEFLLQQTYDRIPVLTHYDELLALIPEDLIPILIVDDYGLYKLKP